MAVLKTPIRRYRYTGMKNMAVGIDNSSYGELRAFEIRWGKSTPQIGHWNNPTAVIFFYCAEWERDNLGSESGCCLQYHFPCGELVAVQSEHEHKNQMQRLYRVIRSCKQCNQNANKHKVQHLWCVTQMFEHCSVQAQAYCAMPVTYHAFM